MKARQATVPTQNSDRTIGMLGGQRLPAPVPGVVAWPAPEVEHFAAAAGCLAVLCDRWGYVRQVAGPLNLLGMAAAIGLEVGVCLADPSGDSNAVGLALERGRSARVTGGGQGGGILHGWGGEARPVWLTVPDAGQPVAVASVWWGVSQVPLTTSVEQVLLLAAVSCRAWVERTRAEWLARMVDELPGQARGYVVLDVAGTLRMATSAARRLLGLNDGEMDLSRALPFLWQQVKQRQNGARTGRVTLQPPAVPNACAVAVEPILGEPGLNLVTVELLHSSHQSARANGTARYRMEDIITVSPNMLSALDLARQAAATEASILLMGESGTGKELVAQAIHRASPRSAGPFVAVNCAAFPRDLIVSELFGHEDGAFTGARRQGSPGRFEQATGGTLFLDEIAEMAQEHQAVLLRVLEDGQVTRLGGGAPRRADVRVVAATNRDLHRDVEEGRFRADLFYRLNVMPIRLAPLRERPDDIVVLATRFLEREASHLGRRLKWSRAALVALGDYHWPGNIRELHNVVKRAAILVTHGAVGPEVLPWRHDILAPETHPEREGALHLADHSAQRSASYRLTAATIHKALVECGGNVSEAARRLCVARSTIYRRQNGGRTSKWKMQPEEH